MRAVSAISANDGRMASILSAVVAKVSMKALPSDYGCIENGDARLVAFAGGYLNGEDILNHRQFQIACSRLTPAMFPVFAARMSARA